MAIKKADVEQNNDGTWTVRVGRQVEHIDPAHKTPGELFEYIKYALISKGMTFDDVEIVDLMHKERRAKLSIIQGGQMAVAEKPGRPVCPECGRDFGSAQGMAVHRRKKHGVKGSSDKTARRQAVKDQEQGQELETKRGSLKPSEVEERMIELVAPSQIQVTLENIDLLKRVEQWVEQGITLREELMNL